MRVYRGPYASDTGQSRVTSALAFNTRLTEVITTDRGTAHLYVLTSGMLHLILYTGVVYYNLHPSTQRYSASSGQVSGFELT